MLFDIEILEFFQSNLRMKLKVESVENEFSPIVVHISWKKITVSIIFYLEINQQTTV